MTSSSVERKIRAQLPIIRFLQTYLPLPVSSWLIRQSLTRAKLAADITHETVSANGVPSEWLTPKNRSKDQALLYLHGGGFVFGLTYLHLEMVAHLAQKIGIHALVVDYRIAPGHPFPAPLEDCVTAYHWLLKQGISAQNIVVAGDSAGGNLTITTMMKLRDNGDPLPAAAACLSPVADLSSNRDNPLKGHDDPLLSPKAIRIYNKS